MRRFLKSRYTRGAISAVIFVNAVVIGLLTVEEIHADMRDFLRIVDVGCLAFFVVEMALKLWAYRIRFFKSPWNCIDLAVIAISLLPQFGMFTTVRIFRSLRVFRVISGTRHLRMIVVAIVNSLPGVGWTAFLLMLIYYVYAILGVYLYGQEFPLLFGSIQKAFFSLFRIMTLDDWWSEIAAPMIKAHSMSWVYFVTFILVSAFIVMNVVVGIFVNSMCEEEGRLHGEDAQRNKARINEMKKQLDRIEKLFGEKIGKQREGRTSPDLLSQNETGVEGKD